VRRGDGLRSVAGPLWGLPALMLAVAVLFWFPPESYSFYPHCPIFEYTGLLCPGCGGTRAFAALLHGHISEALHWNGLAVVTIMVAAVCGGLTLVEEIRIPDRWNRRLMIGAVGVTAGFTVWRNLI
jgi:hypothetical protein